jgi:hypothetical protein
MQVNGFSTFCGKQSKKFKKVLAIAKISVIMTFGIEVKEATIGCSLFVAGANN